MDFSSSWWGGARRPGSRLDRSPGALGASRRPLLRRTTLRRVASWDFLSAAPTASTDAPSTRGRRVPSRVVRASRPLLRRARARSVPTLVFLVFLTRRPRRRPTYCIVRVSRAFGGHKNQSLSGQRSRCWLKTIITTRTLSLHRTDACETDRDSPLRHRSRNRCTHAAQEVRTRRGKSSVTPRWKKEENRCPSSPSAD